MEPVVGLGLLACPSCSSRQLRRLRKLHQFALNSCDNTGSWEDFQPFVQRTSTVCPVHSQKNDFETWCPFWCPSPSREEPSNWLLLPIVRHEKGVFYLEGASEPYNCRHEARSGSDPRDWRYRRSWLLAGSRDCPPRYESHPF